MPREVVAIRRARLFSPSHEQDDWLILKLTADELVRHGCSVTFVDETEVRTVHFNSAVVVNMCQAPAANLHLQGLEDDCLIINTPSSALGCLRYNLLPALERAGVPIPRSMEVDTASPVLPAEVRSWKHLWVKRGDVHATQSGDVTELRGHEPCILRALQTLANRQIPRAILQEHLDGPIVKFYGVRGNGFFRWYPINAPLPFDVDERDLRQVAEMAAESVGLDVYGGDVVVTADRGPCAIDVNDWPTFARFRDEAAASIARHILRKARQRGET